MQITIDRQDLLPQGADLVILVGDPYQDFCGKFDGSLQVKIDSLSQGFGAGSLLREVNFSFPQGSEGGFIDYVYYHTSTEKGFTAVENLKTFLSRALLMAAETGRKEVVMCLRGEHGEGLLDQLVEGALVGTYKFTDFLKDKSDHFADLKLTFALPTLAAARRPEDREPETLLSSGEDLDLSKEQAVDVSTLEGESHTVALEEKEVEAIVESKLTGESEAADAESLAGTLEELDSSSRSEPKASLETHSEDEQIQAIEEDAPEKLPPAAVEQESEVVADVSTRLDEELIAATKAQDEAALRVGRVFGEGVNYARGLICLPASVCTPTYLARAGEELAKKYGFSSQVFTPKELEKQGFIGHLAVGAGSANPPRMLEITYQPEGESSVHLVLLGKGVTFDTGGISIKPSDKMHMMIGDMSGAAAVLGTMQILGELRPSIKVTGLIVSAENAPDGKSYRPGDILRYKNGTSVHVENTDAEGRLLLADGLIRSGEVGATHIVDIATLTGACARALGPSFTGIMGANKKLVSAITRAGGNHGESYWRLPMPVEYKTMLKDFRSDINNVGGAYAGATTAALFLQEFAPKGVPWVHLDIAGTFWKSKAWKYYPEGPSGVGVKTLADLALRWREHMG